MTEVSFNDTNSAATTDPLNFQSLSSEKPLEADYLSSLVVDITSSISAVNKFDTTLQTDNKDHQSVVQSLEPILQTGDKDNQSVVPSVEPISQTDNNDRQSVVPSVETTKSDETDESKLATTHTQDELDGPTGNLTDDSSNNKTDKRHQEFHFAIRTTSAKNPGQDDLSNKNSCPDGSRIPFWVIPFISGITFALVVLGLTVICDMLKSSPSMSTSF